MSQAASIRGTRRRAGRTALALYPLLIGAALVSVAGRATHGQCACDVTVIQGPEDPVFGFPVTIASGLNDLGDVVGYYYYVSSDQSAFMWSRDSGFITLEMPPGTRASRA